MDSSSVVDILEPYQSRRLVDNGVGLINVTKFCHLLVDGTVIE